MFVLCDGIKALKDKAGDGKNVREQQLIEALTSPLLDDIEKLFDQDVPGGKLAFTTKTQSEAEEDLMHILEELQDPATSKQAICDILMQMNEQNKLTTSDTSNGSWMQWGVEVVLSFLGLSSSEALSLDVISKLAAQLFARVQYHFLLKEDSFNPELKRQLEASKAKVLDTLAAKDTVKDVDGLLAAVQAQDQKKEAIKTAMQNLGLQADDADVGKLFAEAQYARILENEQGTQLAEQLNAGKVKVLDALAKKDTVEDVDGLLAAVRAQDKDKTAIKKAMEDLGLQADDDYVGKLFAEAQYARILKKVQGSELEKQLKADVSKAKVLDTLAAKDTVKDVDESLAAVRAQDKDKTAIKKAMEDLGLQADDDHVGKLFAEAQYERIVQQEDGTQLVEQLKASKDNVIVKLAAKDTFDEVNGLLKAVQNPTLTADSMQAPIEALGMQYDSTAAQNILTEHQERQAGVCLALCQTIASDAKKDNFDEYLPINADVAQTKAYLEKLLGKPDYSDIEKTDINWYSDDQINTIREAITTRQAYFVTEDIKTKITERSPYLVASHPRLMTVVNALSTEDKKKLIEKPAILQKLMSATTPNDMSDVVRLCVQHSIDRSKITPEYLVNLCAENKQVKSLQALLNPALAQTLLQNSIELDPPAIEAWNHLILINKDKQLDDDASYRAFVDSLLNTAGRGGTKLPDNPQGNVLRQNLENMKQVIIAEHQCNTSLYAQLAPDSGAAQPSEGEKAALRALIHIKKQSEVPQNEISTLTAVIKDAARYSDLKDACTKAPLKNVVDRCLINWEKTLTEERFNAIKQQYKHERILASDDDCKAIIQEQQALMKEMKTTLQQLSEVTYQDGYVDTGVRTPRAELGRLSRLDPLAWFNRDTEMIAKQHAAEVSEEFEHLAQLCHTTCRGLQEQQRIYQDMLNSMPENPQIQTSKLKATKILPSARDKLKKHRTDIEQELRKTAELLVVYKRLELNLQGDPTSTSDAQRRGILPILRQALELVVADISNKDKPITEKAQYLAEMRVKKDTSDDATNESDVSITGNASRGNDGVFQNTGALEPGKFRPHESKAILSNSGGSSKIIATSSAYTEERDTVKETKTKTGKKVTQPATMTIARFPEAPSGTESSLSEDEKKLLHKAQVKFVTEMAALLLSKMGKVPTAEDPVVLRGSDKKQLGMLWTALIELGKAHPRFKFNQDAIRVDSVFFDPQEKDKQTNWLGSYTKDSYYKQYFSGPSGQPLQDMKASIKWFYDQGFGETQKEQEALQQNKKDITSFYREATTSAKAKHAFASIAEVAKNLPSEEEPPSSPKPH